HHGNAEVGKRLTARSSKVEPPARRLDRVGPGDDVESKSEVFCAAGKRSDHRNGRRRDTAPQRLTARRTHPVSRLMAEDSAAMRRVADRSPNVAVELEPGQPGGQQPQHRPRTHPGFATYPTGCWSSRKPGCSSANRKAAPARWSCRK